MLAIIIHAANKLKFCYSRPVGVSWRKNPTLDYIFGNFRPFFPLYPIFCHRNAREGSPLYKFSIISDSIISDRFVPENVASGREFKIKSII